MRILFPLIALAIILSCKVDKGGLTESEKNAFLEEIYNTDQNFRFRASTIPDSSQEFKRLWDTIPKIDKRNFESISAFLKSNEYPDTINYSVKAAKAPWLVLQHTINVADRLAHYRYIKRGNEIGSVTDIQLYLFLERTYYFDFGEQHEMENTFEKNYASRIPVYEKALGLD